jgi:hypothetical protein
LFVAVQQRMRLRHVGHVASSADHGVDQAGGHIRADVRLHAEVPVVALHRLMHLRIAFLVTVLGRWRRGDQGGVYDSAFAHPASSSCRRLGTSCELIDLTTSWVSNVRFAMGCCRNNQKFIDKMKDIDLMAYLLNSFRTAYSRKYL